MLRRVLGVVAGMLGGFVIVGGIEMIGMKLFPPPQGIDLSTPPEAQLALKDIPVPALITVVIAWGLGALGAGWIASRIARDVREGLIVGLILLVATVANLVTIPHPSWMWAFGILLPLPLAWIGARTAVAPATRL